MDNSCTTQLDKLTLPINFQYWGSIDKINVIDGYVEGAIFLLIGILITFKTKSYKPTEQKVKLHESCKFINAVKKILEFNW